MAKQPTPSGKATKGRPTTGARNPAAARRIRLAVIAGGILAVVAVIGLVISASGGGASGVADPARFDLPAYQSSGRVRLADFRGKPVVVNMYASWCTVCRSELPGFTRESRRLAGKVVFIEVNSEETGNGDVLADEFHLAQAGMILAKDVGPSPASRLHDAYGAQGMPVSAFYDAKGQLLEHDNAGILEPDLGAKLHQFYGV